ncbi:hypothetical protein ZWY2020_053358 [Hordeum vulgare]|nr:hypothetical protein ZWY2020_053358 [Hordeum vulgare]
MKRGEGETPGMAPEAVDSGGDEDEVFDDEGKLLRTIFVENLPYGLRRRRSPRSSPPSAWSTPSGSAQCPSAMSVSFIGSLLVRLGMSCDVVYHGAFAGGTMEGFFNLISYFQALETFCSLASLSVMLNMLAIDPGRLWKGPWRWFVTCIMFGRGRSALAD